MSLSAVATPIPGLLVVNLPVHGDSRGWFKENWQREKMLALGIPDFGPVQNNVSFNSARGVTRGIHAEPWDKFVSVTTGRIFGAWVDLRAGDTFGAVYTHEVGPDTAVFVPRGVGNAYQTLEPGTAYSYLVNDHWSPDADYTFLNLGDPTAAIPWPLPLESAEISEKDRHHPFLENVTPMAPRRTLVLGKNGQLGRALEAVFPHADFKSRAEFDLADTASFDTVRWRDYETVINAAAYTAVDAAETTGRSDAWAVNAAGVGRLARACAEHGVTLVHVSTDYVFDGVGQRPYTEDAPIAPLGVYGQSKAAGEVAARTAPRHYVLRTSWVIGDGSNFVRTMRNLAERGVNPTVVNDQIGRPTFASELALVIQQILRVSAPYGTYNVSGGGAPTSWLDVARSTFELSGHEASRARGTSTAAYFEGKTGIAPRPRWSVLDLEKLERTVGYQAPDWRESLRQYLARDSAPYPINSVS